MSDFNEGPIRGLPQRRLDGYWHDCSECQHLRPRGRPDLGLPVHCNKCHRTWTGNAAQHCLGCHRTFANQFSAEKHPCGKDAMDAFETVREGVWSLRATEAA